MPLGDSPATTVTQAASRAVHFTQGYHAVDADGTAQRQIAHRAAVGKAGRRV